ncbi:hypothetical protein Bhyg_03167 [Pseudolycoriella hygida]|uniref:Uncharacterized protein n=1 Tax=Pseudolycoriella hygida TaxID=35572 RepID=A0A9Q0NCS6_9DIPT|nr:hypothetical protein Bhyg_03167 [Pseudolycoriella hygida]
MNSGRELRSKSKQVAAHNIKSNIAKIAASSTPPVTSTKNKKAETAGQFAAGQSNNFTGITVKQTVAKLNSELEQLKTRNDQSQPLIDSTSEQQEINSNIIIRGVDVSVNTTASELSEIYEGIRNHLEISDVAEFDPISINLLPCNTSKSNSSLRPIRVTLPSVAAKVKFLDADPLAKIYFEKNYGNLETL